ncbi:uncharacterized protein YunC (DUF1805 family) [Melghiribacillus thermohalophilus]|uniref:Uncharacterized protein YunC (DUF1805 family) n=1 Tax=Melghiribacillus thermohalophilus TaxID=1324956 RepID=A0A4R3MUD6_9BACI|nr:DUF1805 domain-containing protein [Melghiribacillus thermohalophilus]TCT19096.1 uncharacterized protein YunC (DUF1805 family) [Melghiribacillus thermohalophilus]
MVDVKPLWVENKPFTVVQVDLPETNLLVISNDKGYIMCGALDVDILDGKTERQIIAGRAVGVRTIEQLLNAPLQKVTRAAKEHYGWKEGMTGREALLKL